MFEIKMPANSLEAVSPIVCRLVDIFDLESLDSILWRQCIKAHYPDPSFITALLSGPVVRTPKHNLLWARDNYKSLYELTLIDIDTLYEHTLHRYAPLFRASTRTDTWTARQECEKLAKPLLTPSDAQRYMRYTRTLVGEAICPQCWSEDRAVLLPWSLLLVTTCPRHQVLLVDTCSNCKEPMRLDYLSGVCQTCWTPVEQNAVQSIEAHAPSKELTELVWAALRHDSELGELSGLTEHRNQRSPLSTLSPKDVLYFCWRFAQLIAMRDPENPLFQRNQLVPVEHGGAMPGVSINPWGQSSQLSVAQLHTLLTGVSRLLLDWPNSFHMTLERLVCNEGPRMSWGRLPQLLVREFAGPEWDWLRAGWRDFMQDNLRNPTVAPWLFHYRTAAQELGLAAEVFSPKQAAKRMGVRVETVKHLIESGIVEATACTPEPSRRKKDVTGDVTGAVGEQDVVTGQAQPGTPNLRRPHRITLVSTAAISRFRKLRKSHLSLIQTSRYLGITEPCARALMRQGLLTGSHALDANRHWLSKDNIKEFLSRVLESCLVREKPLGIDVPTSVSIHDAVCVGRNYGINQARLLGALVDGTLPGYRIGNSQSLAEVWFYRRDVQQYFWRIPTADGRLLIMRSEAMRILRCNYDTLRSWCQVGLLVPVVEDHTHPKAMWRYDLEDVESFRERYIGSAKAAEILQCTGSTLRELAWAGNIPASCIAYTPDAGYGYWLFSRQALERWIKDRILGDEAARLMGVHLETVRKWARIGRLSRVSNIWYSREELLVWRDDMVPTKEAAELLGVSLKTMVKWVKVGNFEPVAVVGKNDKSWYFSRRQLTQWRTARMDSKEVINELDINRPMLDYWLSIGRIRHLNDGFVGKLWFAPAEVTRVLEQLNTTTR